MHAGGAGEGAGGAGGRRRRLSRGIEGAGGRRRRPVDRIWRGGIAIDMEGDRDRVSMKFKNIHDSSKSAHEIQSRNEGYDLNTIDLS